MTNATYDDTFPEYDTRTDDAHTDKFVAERDEYFHQPASMQIVMDHDYQNFNQFRSTHETDKQTDDSEEYYVSHDDTDVYDELNKNRQKKQKLDGNEYGVLISNKSQYDDMYDSTDNPKLKPSRGNNEYGILSGNGSTDIYDSTNNGYNMQQVGGDVYGVASENTTYDSTSEGRRHDDTEGHYDVSVRR